MLKYTAAFYQGKIEGLNVYLNQLNTYLSELEGYRAQLYNIWTDELGTKTSESLNETIKVVKGQIMQVNSTLAYLKKTVTEYEGASDEVQAVLVGFAHYPQ